jgi:hypothetical protein
MLKHLMKKENTLSTPSSIGYDWNISSMRINLWYCSGMKQWRWTLVDNSRPIVRQESGQRPFLRDAMNDVANTVEYMLECRQSE